MILRKIFVYGYKLMLEAQRHLSLLKDDKCER